MSEVIAASMSRSAQFAPANAAFDKIPLATLNTVLPDKATLTKILTYHVVRETGGWVRCGRSPRSETAEIQSPLHSGSLGVAPRGLGGG